MFSPIEGDKKGNGVGPECATMIVARAYMTHRFDVDAHALADTLLDYSELGSQYIEMVHKHLTNIERILNVIR